MSEDFDRMIDEFAANVKRVVGPFGGLLNPQSSHATEKKVADLEARVARQDRLIDSQLDTIEQSARKLRAAEGERDALRAQLEPKPQLKKTLAADDMNT
jgi:hypothetical protein